jgi:hypothetical protein
MVLFRKNATRQENSERLRKERDRRKLTKKVNLSMIFSDRSNTQLDPLYTELAIEQRKEYNKSLQVKERGYHIIPTTLSTLPKIKSFMPTDSGVFIYNSEDSDTTRSLGSEEASREGYGPAYYKFICIEKQKAVNEYRKLTKIYSKLLKSRTPEEFAQNFPQIGKDEKDAIALSHFLYNVRDLQKMYAEFQKIVSVEGIKAIGNKISALKEKIKDLSDKTRIYEDMVSFEMMKDRDSEGFQIFNFSKDFEAFKQSYENPHFENLVNILTEMIPLEQNEGDDKVLNKFNYLSQFYFRVDKNANLLDMNIINFILQKQNRIRFQKEQGKPYDINFINSKLNSVFNIAFNSKAFKANITRKLNNDTLNLNDKYELLWNIITNAQSVIFLLKHLQIGSDIKKNYISLINILKTDYTTNLPIDYQFPNFTLNKLEQLLNPKIRALGAEGIKKVLEHLSPLFTENTSKFEKISNFLLTDKDVNLEKLYKLFEIFNVNKSNVNLCRNIQPFYVKMPKSTQAQISELLESPEITNEFSEIFSPTLFLDSVESEPEVKMRQFLTPEDIRAIDQKKDLMQFYFSKILDIFNDKKNFMSSSRSTFDKLQKTFKFTEQAARQFKTTGQRMESIVSDRRRSLSEELEEAEQVEVPEYIQKFMNLIFYWNFEEEDGKRIHLNGFSSKQYFVNLLESEDYFVYSLFYLAYYCNLIHRNIAESFSQDPVYAGILQERMNKIFPFNDYEYENFFAGMLNDKTGFKNSIRSKNTDDIINILSKFRSHIEQEKISGRTTTKKTDSIKEIIVYYTNAFIEYKSSTSGNLKNIAKKQAKFASIEQAITNRLKKFLPELYKIVSETNSKFDKKAYRLEDIRLFGKVTAGTFKPEKEGKKQKKFDLFLSDEDIPGILANNKENLDDILESLRAERLSTYKLGVSDPFTKKVLTEDGKVVNRKIVDENGKEVKSSYIPKIYKNLESPINFDLRFETIVETIDGVKQAITTPKLVITMQNYNLNDLTKEQISIQTDKLSPISIMEDRFQHYLKNVSLLIEDKKSQPNPIFTVDDKDFEKLATYTVELIQLAHFCIYNTSFGFLYQDDKKESIYKSVNRNTIKNLILGGIGSLIKILKTKSNTKTKVEKLEKFYNIISPIFNPSKFGLFSIEMGKEIYEDHDLLFKGASEDLGDIAINEKILTTDKNEIITDIDIANTAYQNRREKILKISEEVKALENFKYVTFEGMTTGQQGDNILASKFLSADELTRQKKIDSKVTKLEIQALTSTDKNYISKIRKAINNELVKSPIALKLKYVKEYQSFVLPIDEKIRLNYLKKASTNIKSLITETKNEIEKVKATNINSLAMFKIKNMGDENPDINLKDVIADLKNQASAKIIELEQRLEALEQNRKFITSSITKLDTLIKSLETEKITKIQKQYEKQYQKLNNINTVEAKLKIFLDSERKDFKFSPLDKDNENLHSIIIRLLRDCSKEEYDVNKVAELFNKIFPVVDEQGQPVENGLSSVIKNFDETLVLLRTEQEEKALKHNFQIIGELDNNFFFKFQNHLMLKKVVEEMQAKRFEYFKHLPEIETFDEYEKFFDDLNEIAKHSVAKYEKLVLNLENYLRDDLIDYDVEIDDHINFLEQNMKKLEEIGPETEDETTVKLLEELDKVEDVTSEEVEILKQVIPFSGQNISLISRLTGNQKTEKNPEGDRFYNIIYSIIEGSDEFIEDEDYLRYTILFKTAFEFKFFRDLMSAIKISIEGFRKDGNFETAEIFKICSEWYNTSLENLSKKKDILNNLIECQSENSEDYESTIITIKKIRAKLLELYQHKLRGVSLSKDGLTLSGTDFKEKLKKLGKDDEIVEKSNNERLKELDQQIDKYENEINKLLNWEKENNRSLVLHTRDEKIKTYEQEIDFINHLINSIKKPRNEIVSRIRDLLTKKIVGVPDDTNKKITDIIMMNNINDINKNTPTQVRDQIISFINKYKKETKEGKAPFSEIESLGKYGLIGANDEGFFEASDVVKDDLINIIKNSSNLFQDIKGILPKDLLRGRETTERDLYKIKEKIYRWNIAINYLQFLSEASIVYSENSTIARQEVIDSKKKALIKKNQAFLKNVQNYEPVSNEDVDTILKRYPNYQTLLDSAETVNFRNVMTDEQKSVPVFIYILSEFQRRQNIKNNTVKFLRSPDAKEFYFLLSSLNVPDDMSNEEYKVKLLKDILDSYKVEKISEIKDSLLDAIDKDTEIIKIESEIDEIKNSLTYNSTLSEEEKDVIIAELYEEFQSVQNNSKAMMNNFDLNLELELNDKLKDFTIEKESLKGEYYNLIYSDDEIENPKIEIDFIVEKRQQFRQMVKNIQKEEQDFSTEKDFFVLQNVRNVQDYVTIKFESSLNEHNNNPLFRKDFEAELTGKGYIQFMDKCKEILKNAKISIKDFKFAMKQIENRFVNFDQKSRGSYVENENDRINLEKTQNIFNQLNIVDPDEYFNSIQEFLDGSVSRIHNLFSDLYNNSSTNIEIDEIKQQVNNIFSKNYKESKDLHKIVLRYISQNQILDNDIVEKITNWFYGTKNDIIQRIDSHKKELKNDIAYHYELQLRIEKFDKNFNHITTNSSEIGSEKRAYEKYHEVKNMIKKLYDISFDLYNKLINQDQGNLPDTEFIFDFILKAETIPVLENSIKQGKNDLSELVEKLYLEDKEFNPYLPMYSSLADSVSKGILLTDKKNAIEPDNEVNDELKNIIKIDIIKDNLNIKMVRRENIQEQYDYIKRIMDSYLSSEHFRSSVASYLESIFKFILNKQSNITTTSIANFRISSELFRKLMGMKKESNIIGKTTKSLSSSNFRFELPFSTKHTKTILADDIKEITILFRENKQDEANEIIDLGVAFFTNQIKQGTVILIHEQGEDGKIQEIKKDLTTFEERKQNPVNTLKENSGLAKQIEKDAKKIVSFSTQAVEQIEARNKLVDINDQMIKHNNTIKQLSVVYSLDRQIKDLENQNEMLAFSLEEQVSKLEIAPRENLIKNEIRTIKDNIVSNENDIKKLKDKKFEKLGFYNPDQYKDIYMDSRFNLLKLMSEAKEVLEIYYASTRIEEDKKDLRVIFNSLITKNVIKPEIMDIMETFMVKANTPKDFGLELSVSGPDDLNTLRSIDSSGDGYRVDMMEQINRPLTGNTKKHIGKNRFGIKEIVEKCDNLKSENYSNNKKNIAVLKLIQKFIQNYTQQHAKFFEDIDMHILKLDGIEKSFSGSDIYEAITLEFSESVSKLKAIEKFLEKKIKSKTKSMENIFINTEKQIGEIFDSVLDNDSAEKFDFEPEVFKKSRQFKHDIDPVKMDEFIQEQQSQLESLIKPTNNKENFTAEFNQLFREKFLSEFEKSNTEIKKVLELFEEYNQFYQEFSELPSIEQIYDNKVKIEENRELYNKYVESFNERAKIGKKVSQREREAEKQGIDLDTEGDKEYLNDVKNSNEAEEKFKALQNTTNFKRLIDNYRLKNFLGEIDNFYQRAKESLKFFDAINSFKFESSDIQEAFTKAILGKLSNETFVSKKDEIKKNMVALISNLYEKFRGEAFKGGTPILNKNLTLNTSITLIVEKIGNLKAIFNVLYIMDEENKENYVNFKNSLNSFFDVSNIFDLIKNQENIDAMGIIGKFLKKHSSQLMPLEGKRRDNSIKLMNEIIERVKKSIESSQQTINNLNNLIDEQFLNQGKVSDQVNKFALYAKQNKMVLSAEQIKENVRKAVFEFFFKFFNVIIESTKNNNIISIQRSLEVFIENLKNVKKETNKAISQFIDISEVSDSLNPTFSANMNDTDYNLIVTEIMNLQRERAKRLKYVEDNKDNPAKKGSVTRTENEIRMLEMKISIQEERKDMYDLERVDVSTFAIVQDKKAKIEEKFKTLESLTKDNYSIFEQDSKNTVTLFFNLFFNRTDTPGTITKNVDFVEIEGKKLLLPSETHNLYSLLLKSEALGVVFNQTLKTNFLDFMEEVSNKFVSSLLEFSNLEEPSNHQDAIEMVQTYNILEKFYGNLNDPKNKDLRKNVDLFFRRFANELQTLYITFFNENRDNSKNKNDNKIQEGGLEKVKISISNQFNNLENEKKYIDKLYNQTKKLNKGKTIAEIEKLTLEYSDILRKTGLMRSIQLELKKVPPESKKNAFLPLVNQIAPEFGIKNPEDYNRVDAELNTKLNDITQRKFMLVIKDYDISEDYNIEETGNDLQDYVNYETSIKTIDRKINDYQELIIKIEKGAKRKEDHFESLEQIKNKIKELNERVEVLKSKGQEVVAGAVSNTIESLERCEKLFSEEVTKISEIIKRLNDKKEEFNERKQEILNIDNTSNKDQLKDLIDIRSQLLTKDEEYREIKSKISDLYDTIDSVYISNIQKEIVKEFFESLSQNDLYKEKMLKIPESTMTSYHNLCYEAIKNTKFLKSDKDPDRIRYNNSKITYFRKTFQENEQITLDQKMIVDYFNTNLMEELMIIKIKSKDFAGDFETSRIKMSELKTKLSELSKEIGYPDKVENVLNQPPDHRAIDYIEKFLSKDKKTKTNEAGITRTTTTFEEKNLIYNYFEALKKSEESGISKNKIEGQEEDLVDKLSAISARNILYTAPENFDIKTSEENIVEYFKEELFTNIAQKIIMSYKIDEIQTQNKKKVEKTKEKVQSFGQDLYEKIIDIFKSCEDLKESPLMNEVDEIINQFNIHANKISKRLSINNNSLNLIKSMLMIIWIRDNVKLNIGSIIENQNIVTSLFETLEQIADFKKEIEYYNLFSNDIFNVQNYHLYATDDKSTEIKKTISSINSEIMRVLKSGLNDEDELKFFKERAFIEINKKKQPLEQAIKDKMYKFKEDGKGFRKALETGTNIAKNFNGSSILNATKNELYDLFKELQELKEIEEYFISFSESDLKAYKIKFLETSKDVLARPSMFKVAKPLQPIEPSQIEAKPFEKAPQEREKTLEEIERLKSDIRQTREKIEAIDRMPEERKKQMQDRRSKLLITLSSYESNLRNLRSKV